MQLPEAFLSRMKQRLGDFPAFLRSYDLPPARGLRINTLKLSPEEFLKISPYPVGDAVGSDPACRYIGEEKFGTDVFHAAGLYYLQEPSAMTVGADEEVRGKRVLDLCAAPGGKATHLAALMQGEGILIANETVYSRAKILTQNIERMGVKNCAVTSATPSFFAERFEGYFDVVLVDAPCSGEGMFKKEQNAVPNWSEKNVVMCAARQRAILDDAARAVRGGGRLLYSTCTFAEEEDEWQIEGFLKRHPDFTLITMSKLYPHTFRGEGHFFAVLKKTNDDMGYKKPYPLLRNAKAERVFYGFYEDVFGESFSGSIHTLADGRMYLVPEGMPDCTGASMLRLGVELGEWDGKIFKPAHALAMAMGEKAKRVALSREGAAAYLRGETIETDLSNGYVVVCVEKSPLGWGKCVDGTVKNRLPTPLRIRP